MSTRRDLQRVVIQPGDWLGAIAWRHGFADPAQIWNAPENAALRDERGSPDLLMVGDVIVIPPPGEQGTAVVVERQTRITLERRRTHDVLRLRVTELDAVLAALGSIDYVFVAGRSRGEGRLEQAGQVLELPLDGDATTATLTLVGLREFVFAIGGLGPIDEPKGAYQRLANLGFTTAGPPQHRPGPEAAVDPLAAALTAFQRARGLPPSGTLDAATRDALHAAYGS